MQVQALPKKCGYPWMFLHLQFKIIAGFPNEKILGRYMSYQMV
jgi:hypothetical protein